MPVLDTSTDDLSRIVPTPEEAERLTAAVRRLRELSDPRRPKAKLVKRLPHEYQKGLGPGEFE